MQDLNNLVVNNKAVADILTQISPTNVKLSGNTQDNSNYHNYFLPQKLIRNTGKPILIDTYGILSKSKLLLREPIIGNQISFCHSEQSHPYSNEEKGMFLNAENKKIFYSYVFENLDHKYSSSFFTNLKSKNINIVFPSNSCAHLIADNVSTLKYYAKKVFSLKINEDKILMCSLPLNISILENNKLIKSIAIKNKSYLGICHQLANILYIFMKNPKNEIKSSDNYVNYINQIFFTFYNFLPNFLNTHIFKFLLRLSGPFSFSNQILEVNNFYTEQNYFFTNEIDDNQSKSIFLKGNFLPDIKIEGSTKTIYSLLSGESNLICSYNFPTKQKINTILLANSSSSNQSDAKINDSAYELLNLDNYYYLVSSAGIITMIELNSNLKKKSQVSSQKSRYSDLKQKTLDTFDAKKFNPTLPKFSLRFPFFQKN